MTRKLGAIADWVRVDKGNSIVLPGEKYRKVRVELMSIIQTSLLMWVGDKREMFPLGNVDGHQVIEFYVEGDVVIDADANVFYKSVDGQTAHIELPDAVTFTKIATRRARNLRQELVEYQMWQNSNKRIAKLEAEFHRKMEALGVDPRTGEVVDDKRPKSGSVGAKPKGDKQHQEKPKSGDGGEGSEPKQAAGDELANGSEGVGKPPSPADG